MGKEVGGGTSRGMCRGASKVMGDGQAEGGGGTFRSTREETLSEDGQREEPRNEWRNGQRWVYKVQKEGQKGARESTQMEEPSRCLALGARALTAGA